MRYTAAAVGADRETESERQPGAGAEAQTAIVGPAEDRRRPASWAARAAEGAEALLHAGGRLLSAVRGVDPILARQWTLGRALDALGRSLRRRWSPLEPRPPKRVLWPRQSDHPAARWVYRNEDWGRVVDRWEHRRALQQGEALLVEDLEQRPAVGVRVVPDSIRAAVEAGGRERWVYLYIDPQQNLWRDFRWSFRARRGSEFRELQFGFRYVDFYNRYRFRHQDDCLYFDIVCNGAFYNSIQRIPFVMNLGQDYFFEIEARGNRFTLTVDGVLSIDERDSLNLFPRGSAAVILFQDDGRSPIAASIEDIRVVEI